MSHLLVPQIAHLYCSKSERKTNASIVSVKTDKTKECIVESKVETKKTYITSKQMSEDFKIIMSSS